VLGKSVTKTGESTVRVLLLECSLADLQDVLEKLRASGMPIEPTVLSMRHEFLEAIGSQDFSVILSEYRLDGWNALEALDELKRAGKLIPFVTRTLSQDDAAETAELSKEPADTGLPSYASMNGIPIDRG
jgi:CheY-like chemotaxis protein